MDRVSTRTWATIAMIGIALFSYYWLRFSVKHQIINPEGTLFSYVMPRPSNYEPGFDISDRAVERRYKTLPALPALDPKKMPALVDAKKLDPKKAAQAKADAAKKAAQAQAAGMVKHKSNKVEVVNTGREQSMEKSAVTFQPAEVLPAAAIPKSAAPVADNSGNGTEQPAEETVLTPNQWRSLLQNSPTAANVSAFIKAKQGGKLDAASYYQITHELLVDAAKDRETAGLSVVKSDASSATFSFIVGELAKDSAAVQTALQAEIATYSAMPKLSILVGVLSSSQNPAVLSAAAADLGTAVSSYQAHPAGQPSAQGAGTVTATQLAAFIPTLQKLATGATPVAATATQLLTSIQTISSPNHS